MMKTSFKLATLAVTLISGTAMAANELYIPNYAYHSQDVRNVSTKVHVTYEDSGDTLNFGGQYGINGVAAVGLDYRNWDGGNDSDTFNINGQYNINQNVVIHGSYDFDAANQLTVGGKYVMPVSFGIVDLGANYLNSNSDDTLEFEAGLLVPIELFYYRGDVSYQTDAGEEFRFGNKFGWSNGQVDANLSLNYVDAKHWDDTFFGFEVDYYF
ncbi:hypothetical protein [Vibrio sp. HN007]|uniref:hypothetical protein n=1 Tax=Vibrio iocasae TaxID=3098914 RepID=UPI0035D45058